ncbi:MAG: type II secretion system protein J [Opitutales bacterium]
MPKPTAYPNKARQASAFSLIEVLIALALFAMAGIVLSSAFVNALLARERGRGQAEQVDDLRLARQQLLLEPNRDDAEAGGDVETVHAGTATWQARIETTDLVDLFEVHWSVEFFDPPEDHARTYEETLYLLRPTWSEQDERSRLLEEKKQVLRDSRSFRPF